MFLETFLSDYRFCWSLANICVIQNEKRNCSLDLFNLGLSFWENLYYVFFLTFHNIRMKISQYLFMLGKKQSSFRNPCCIPIKVLKADLRFSFSLSMDLHFPFSTSLIPIKVKFSNLKWKNVDSKTKKRARSFC